MTNSERYGSDTRYPYTYACDYIRSLVGYVAGGTKLSRSDASHIRTAIAAAIDMNDATLAERLADLELQKTDEQISAQVTEFLSSQYGEDQMACWRDDFDGGASPGHWVTDEEWHSRSDGKL